jgi:hypothetical protein
VRTLRFGTMLVATLAARQVNGVQIGIRLVAGDRQPEHAFVGQGRSQSHPSAVPAPIDDMTAIASDRQLRPDKVSVADPFRTLPEIA